MSPKMGYLATKKSSIMPADVENSPSLVNKFQLLGSVKSVNIFCFLFFGDVYESGFEITPGKKQKISSPPHRDITDSCRFRPWPKTRLSAAISSFLLFEPTECTLGPTVHFDQWSCVITNKYHKIRPLQQIYLDHSAHCRKAAKSLKQANCETGRSKQADRETGRAKQADL